MLEKASSVKTIPTAMSYSKANVINYQDKKPKETESIEKAGYSSVISKAIIRPGSSTGTVCYDYKQIYEAGRKTSREGAATIGYEGFNSAREQNQILMPRQNAGTQKIMLVKQ